LFDDARSSFLIPVQNRGEDLNDGKELFRSSWKSPKDSLFQLNLGIAYTDVKFYPSIAIDTTYVWGIENALMSFTWSQLHCKIGL